MNSEADFKAIFDLIAIAANPEAAKARLAEIMGRELALAAREFALVAREASFAKERAAGEERHEREMRDLAVRLRQFATEQEDLRQQKEYLEEFGRRRGFHEPLTSIPMGNGGSMSVFPEEPEEEDHLEEMRHRRNSSDCFGQSTITKAEELPERPSPARSPSVFHQRKHRTA